VKTAEKKSGNMWSKKFWGGPGQRNGIIREKVEKTRHRRGPFAMETKCRPGGALCLTGAFGLGQERRKKNRRGEERQNERRTFVIAEGLLLGGKQHGGRKEKNTPEEKGREKGGGGASFTVHPGCWKGINLGEPGGFRSQTWKTHPRARWRDMRGVDTWGSCLPAKQRKEGPPGVRACAERDNNTQSRRKNGRGHVRKRKGNQGLCAPSFNQAREKETGWGE